LNLTVNQPSASTINDTICAPNSYNFIGQSYSVSGTYTATLTNISGCDSVITLNLVVRNCTFTIGTRFNIEGFYRHPLGRMTPVLFNLGISSDSTSVDSVTLSLWNPLDLVSPLYSGQTILKSNGFAFIQVPDSLRGRSLFVSVNHRSSMFIWSAVPINWSDSTQYDFTLSSSSAYSNGFNLPMKQLPDGKYGLYSGDFNQDGLINVLDLNYVWLSNFGSVGASYVLSDITGDGVTNLLDLDMTWYNTFGSTAAARP